MLRKDDALVTVGHDIRVPEYVAAQSYAVYVLVDPRTNRVRYVGCTKKIKARRIAHTEMKNAAGANLRQWFAELRAAGLSPIFRIDTLFTGCCAQIAAEHVEKRLIEHYANDVATGDLLCNGRDNPRFEWPFPSKPKPTA